MTDAAWVALGSLLLSLGTAIVISTVGIRKISDNVSAKLGADIDVLKKAIADSELMYERRMGETGAALREKISQVEFHIRDKYVPNHIFERMIDMAAANNENQFKTLQESINRIIDQLNSMTLGPLRP